jgi:hypothetical protein
MANRSHEESVEENIDGTFLSSYIARLRYIPHSFCLAGK